MGDDLGPVEEEEQEDAAADEREGAEQEEAETGHQVLERARQMIRDYYTSERTSDLELPSSLSRNARKELHIFADSYALHHRAVGPEGDRRLLVSRWRPIY